MLHTLSKPSQSLSSRSRHPIQHLIDQIKNLELFDGNYEATDTLSSEKQQKLTALYTNLSQEIDKHYRSKNALKNFHKRSINWKDREGKSLLYLVSELSKIDCFIQVLCRKEASTNLHTHDGKTLLHTAKGKYIRSLLKLKAPISKAMDSKGETALHAAVLQNDILKTRFLLEDSRNIWKRYQTTQEARLISSENYIDPNAKNYEGKTALHLATQYGYTDIILELIGELSPFPLDLDIQDDQGKTAGIYWNEYLKSNNVSISIEQQRVIYNLLKPVLSRIELKP